MWDHSIALSSFWREQVKAITASPSPVGEGRVR